MSNCRPLLFTLLFAWLAACPVKAEPTGWSIEPGTDDPRYAVVQPVATNLNISAVALTCEDTGTVRVLQLQIYRTDDGPLRAKAALAAPMKDEPRAALVIDGRVFPVSPMFADTYAVLADGSEGLFAKLSSPLVAALQSGKAMTLQLDLIAEPHGQSTAFDGEAVVPLADAGGRAAIAAMRRCIGPGGVPGARLARLRH